MTTVIVLLVLASLAAVNGANDVSKGVATLAGSGVARYRSAVVWGAATTLAGSLLSFALAGQMLKLFTGGIVSAAPTAAFTFAVVVGAAGWVAIATFARLPVSTTHAIVGALIGVGVLFSPESIAWAALLPKVVLPLLASIAASFAISGALNIVLARRAPAAPDCVCVVVAELETGSARMPILHLETCTAARSAPEGGFLRFDLSSLHWLSSGCVGFARGLNDSPKLVAIGAGLAGATLTTGWLFVIVAAAMLAGSLVGGLRVAKVLGENVVRMSHREGLLANLTSAVLVGFGANLGLPMSTTHVSTGAIAGIAGTDVGRLNRKTIRDLLIAWTVTPLVASLLAMAGYLIASRLI